LAVKKKVATGIERIIILVVSGLLAIAGAFYLTFVMTSAGFVIMAPLSLASGGFFLVVFGLRFNRYEEKESSTAPLHRPESTVNYTEPHEETIK
jgi:hypothetical protein